MSKESIVRRSVSFPKELDDRIDIVKNQYSYKAKNELILELVERGLLSFYDDRELKNKIDGFKDTLDNILKKLEIS